MSKITLNFFGEMISVEKPKNLLTLRNDISRLFCFSAQDAAEIILTYNDNGDKLVIESDKDLKAFFDSKNTIIDLDISQESKIFQDSLNQLKEDSLKDQKALDELIKKRKELNKLRETKFASEKNEMKEIQKQIMELIKKKNIIRKKIFEGVREIEKERKENEKKIAELQKKLGLPVTEPEKKVPPKICKKIVPFIHCQERFAPQCHFHPKVFHLKHRNHKKPFGVKFGNTEYIDIPKETEEKNNEIDLKMKTIDDWGKCLLSKTQEITNKLAEKFKGFPTLNLSLNTTEDKKEEKEEKKRSEIHNGVRCDGCGMNPLIGKRYKCKGCHNFDYCQECYEKNKVKHGHEFQLIEKKFFEKLFFPKERRTNPFLRHSSRETLLHLGKKLFEVKPEGVPKKMEHCPTMGNILEKDKISNKIVHFGVKCDGCKKYPIIGCRFKCAVCDNFDYCEDCEQKFAEKHNHPFLKIYEPKMKPAYIKCITKSK